MLLFFKAEPISSISPEILEVLQCTPHVHARPEPNMLLFFLPIMLFGNAQFFYRLCSKLCPIMPVNFARESI